MIIWLLLSISVSLTSIVRIPFFANDSCKVIEFYYSKDGRDWYIIASLRNPNYPDTWKDEFVWVFRGKYPKDARIKVVYVFSSKKCEDTLNEVDINVKNVDFSPHFYYKNEAVIDHEDTTYSWRMLGYDAQHTGYYPHPLAPPLEERWSFHALYNDFTMISASCANGCLYVGNGGRRLYAIDIYSGNTIWVQWLTSNVWTTALAPGDTLLFAGTSIEPTLTWPTFFCLDARTGEVKWSKNLATVEFQPIVVDSIVYFTNLQGAIYAFSIRGVKRWETYASSSPVDLGSPAYWLNKIFVGGENCALLVLHSDIGDTLWRFAAPGWIDCTPVVYKGAVYFFSGGYLYALDVQNGNILWKHYAFEPGPIPRPIVYENKLYYNTYSRGVDNRVYAIIHCLDTSNGKVLWKALPLSGGAINGMVITSNEIFWSPNAQYLYALHARNGDILFQKITSDDNWQCWFWPIIYKNYILIAGDRVTAYEGKIPVDSTITIYCFPNPAHDIVNIQVKLIESGEVELQIYNPLGVLVKSLYHNVLTQGIHTITWDGTNNFGRRVTSSTYFLVIKTGKNHEVTKFVYIR